MLVSAGGLFTSLLSWSIPQSVQKRVVYFFLRNTLGRFLSTPDLNSPDSFEFHDGALLLQSLEFDMKAVQEILPSWSPSIKRLHIESIRVQLPWPNIFTGTVNVFVQAPRAIMIFKDEADPSSPLGSPELEIDDSNRPESDIPLQPGDIEHPGISYETSTSTFENLVTSFGKALVQRLKVLVEDVDIRVGFKNGATIIKVQEFSFDGEKENMSCKDTLIQALRPRSYTHYDYTSPPVTPAISLKYPLFESDRPDYIAADILRIKECMKLHVRPGNAAGRTEPLISLEAPCIILLASYYDILFCLALSQTLFYSLQTSSGSSNNTLDLSIGSASIHLHISCLTTCILFEEKQSASKEQLSAHLAMECQNLIVEAHYDGSRITSSTSRIERLFVHDVSEDGTRSPFIRIKGKHQNVDAILTDSQEWALGSCCIGQGDWNSINALTSSLDQAITLNHSGPNIHLEMASAQLLLDSELIYRALPFLRFFDRSSSNSSRQDTTSMPWSFIHDLLMCVPIMTISCEKGQMVLRVPEAQITEAACIFKSPRSGLWFLECENIHTRNSRTQELSSNVCVHVDTSRVSIYQSSDYEAARYLCDFRDKSDTITGIQIDINLCSTPTKGCTASLYLDIPDLVVGLDNPFVHSIYYIADDFLKFAYVISTSWAQTPPEVKRNPTDLAPSSESELRPSLESFLAGASIHISLQHGALL